MMIRAVILTMLCAVPAAGGPAQPQMPQPAPVQPAVPPAVGAEQPAVPPAAVPAAGLPLSDVLGRAVVANPALVTARQRLRQAEFQARAAGIPPGVTLNTGVHVGRDAAGDDEDIFLSGRVELFGKRRLRVEAARLAVAAARARVAQAQSELTFQVRAAYAGLQEAAAAEALAAENVELARTLLRLSELRLEAGDVAETVVLRAQVELQTAEQALTGASALTAGRRAALNTLLGEDPGAPLPVTPAELPAAREMGLEALRQRALTRPDVQAEERTLASRRAQVAVARVGRRPDLTVDAAHASLTELSGNVLRVGLAFPLFDFGLSRANTALARAAADEQAAVVSLARRQALQDVETAYVNLTAARRQAEQLSSVLEKARRLRDLSELGFREGQFTIIEVLDAQRAFREVFAQYQRALAAAAAAEAALERAVGSTGPLQALDER